MQGPATWLRYVVRRSRRRSAHGAYHPSLTTLCALTLFFLVGDAADLVDKSERVNFRYVRFTAIGRLQESFYMVCREKDAILRNFCRPCPQCKTLVLRDSECPQMYSAMSFISTKSARFADTLCAGVALSATIHSPSSMALLDECSKTK